MNQRNDRGWTEMNERKDGRLDWNEMREGRKDWNEKKARRMEGCFVWGRGSWITMDSIIM